MRNSTIQAGVIPFWFFNDASTVAERIRYLRACHKGGIRAMAMHCRSGNLIPYASTEWCETCGLNLVGHMSPEDDPVAEVGCLGSVMPLMKILHCPGTDLIAPFVGNRETPPVNLGSLRAGSLRAQTGAAAVSESCALLDWDPTTAKCHQILAWQKVLGIDRFFLHGFFSSVEGVVVHEAPPD